MNTAPAYDLLLADMVSAYQAEETPAKKPAKVKLIKDSVRVEKVVDRSTVETTTVPATNGEEPKSETRVVALKVSLGPKEFLVALRNAGYRKDNQGKSFLDKSEIRPDAVKAIDAYCGYDPKGDFGSQELNAKSKAQREIRKANGEDLGQGPTRDEIRRAQASLKGFVNGNPDLVKQKIADLEAREAMAAAELIEQEKLGETLPTEQERAKAKAKAQLERERIQSIRKDLAAFGV